MDNYKAILQSKDENFDTNTPRIVVVGVGGAGCNAVNNMISNNLKGVDFFVINTDAQSLNSSKCENKIHIGENTLGAGSMPELGRKAAEYSIDSIFEKIGKANMLFIAAGMGGGTGTGASPVIAKRARELDMLTVGVFTKPFIFEGNKRMSVAEAGIEDIQGNIDTLIVVPNQNIFKLSGPETTLQEAFKLADTVLYNGVRGITDLMLQDGLVNLDFADVKTVMTSMGSSMMGVGVSEVKENRAKIAAETAINNPLMDCNNIQGATNILVNVTGGNDIKLFDVESAVQTIGKESKDAKLIFGTCIRDDMEGKIQVTVFASGIQRDNIVKNKENRFNNYSSTNNLDNSFKNVNNNSYKVNELSQDINDSHSLFNRNSYSNSPSYNEDSHKDNYLNSLHVKTNNNPIEESRGYNYQNHGNHYSHIDIENNQNNSDIFSNDNNKIDARYNFDNNDFSSINIESLINETKKKSISENKDNKTRKISLSRSYYDDN